ncbi:MAG: response regulator transcription factor [Ilumatobacter fluminis]|uniref:response regulator transcription factor n=1 Tax=Ilumatobacter fluminis TaxID=467091 RepID=UPI0032EB2847
MRDHERIEPHPSLRVVIIDDHVMFAEGVAASLRATGEVDVAAIAPTADEGEAAVGVHRPHVVLLDFGLPDDDGVTLARRLHQRFPEAKLVMVTSLVDERLVLRAVEAGCAGFVTKDRTVDELVAAIRSVADGEALISPVMLNKVLRQIRRRSEGTVGSDLSDREREVLQYVCDGLTNPAIAERLHVSHNTVRSHVQNILSKLQVHSKLEAAAVATRSGLVEPR